MCGECCAASVLLILICLSEHIVTTWSGDCETSYIPSHLPLLPPDAPLLYTLQPRSSIIPAP